VGKLKGLEGVLSKVENEEKDLFGKNHKKPKKKKRKSKWVM